MGRDLENTMNFEVAQFVAEEPEGEEFLFETRIEERGEREKAYADFIREIVANPDNFIDKGGAGEVFSFRQGKVGLCVKVIENRHDREDVQMFNLGNSLLQEAHFLEYLSHFRVRDVRVPVYVEALPGDKKGLLVMEQLDAVNLQHLISGEEEFPDNFNPEDFFSSLDKFVTEMHDFKKVAHMDLEARNIMVDRKTGRARIIDFGRAIFLTPSEVSLNKKRMEKDYADLEAVEEKVNQIYNSK